MRFGRYAAGTGRARVRRLLEGNVVGNRTLTEGNLGRAKDVLAKIAHEKVCRLRVSLADLGGNHDGMAKPKNVSSGHFYF
jgi:hypothetical protein